MATRVVLCVALIAALAALAGCGGSGDSEDTPETTAPAATTAPSTTETTETTPKPETTTIVIRVVGGKPQGGIARPSVERGTRVVLVVRSDLADEMHLHGYDLSRPVPAGGTVRLPFVAKIPGRFEVELEDLGVQLAELTVR